MPIELYLIRHGQSRWNAERRHQGQLESPLTERGRAQARAVGRAFAREIANPARFAALTSPLGRARETAALVLAPLGLMARPDPRLMEVHLGAWQGLTDPEIFARWPEAEDAMAADPFGWHFTAPGGERMEGMKARLRAVLAGLAGPTVIVAHGGTLRVLRALVLGLDDDAMRALPGGQGVIWHLKDGVHRTIAPAAGDGGDGGTGKAGPEI